MRRCRYEPVARRSADSDVAERLWRLWVVVSTTPVVEPETGVAADDALLDQLGRTPAGRSRGRRDGAWWSAIHWR